MWMTIGSFGQRRPRLSVFLGWITALAALLGCLSPAYAGDPYRVDPVWEPLSSAAGNQENAATLVVDPVRDRMIMTGGTCSSVLTVYACPLAGPFHWEAIPVEGEVPPWRYGHAAIYDPVRDQIVIFGGQQASAMRDAWALSLTTRRWTRLPDAPVDRDYPSAIYDPDHQTMLVFGGVEANGTAHNELLALSLAGSSGWSLPVVLNPPPARYAHSAVYDSNARRMVVFGGFTRTACLEDLWTLDLSDTYVWSPVVAAGQPGPRYGHTACIDPIGEAMIVFGGRCLSYPGTNDTWFFDLTTNSWSQLSPGPPSPAGRCYHMAVFDPTRDRMLVCGGYGGSGSNRCLDDIWSLGLDSNHAPNLTFLSPAPGNVQVFQGNSFRIEWDDTDPDDNAVLSLYRNPGCDPAGDVVIAPALQEEPEGTGDCYPQGEGDCYDWNTSPVPPGIYHLRASMIDGHHREVWRCSEGTVEILPPSVDLTCGSAPRPNSGQPASPWNIGQEIEFEMDIENQGSLPAGTFTVGFYLGTSADDYSDRRRFEPISSLDAASSTLPQWRISFHVRDVGWRYLNVWIDDGNEVGEGSHEENNRCSYGPFFIEDPTVDQNKLGPVVAGTGHVLFYEDQQANNCHDPGEPFLNHDPGGYIETPDNSCWMAAACNLLEYENWPHPYTTWLREGCGTAPYSGPWDREIPPPCGSSMTLDDRGYAHWALRAAGAAICGPIFTATPSGGAWNRDPITWCSQRLADGYPVVLSVFWGQTRDDGRVGRRTQDSGRHALTLWGLEMDGQTVILTDSDDQYAGPRECAFTYSGEDWILRDAWDGTDPTVYEAVSLAGAEGCRTDLACDPVQIAPSPPPPGTPATLATRVRNLGESLAPASVTAMRMDGLPLAQCPFTSTPELYLDQEFPISCQIEVWDGQEHRVVACADANHEVAEADEGNNCPEVMVESDVDAVAEAPDQVTFGPVHPNPAQSLTTCQLGIPPQLGGSEVELTVYNASGAAVRTVRAGTARPGWSTVTWDGFRNDGHRVPSGVYLLRVRIGKEVRSRSVIVSR